MDRFDLELAQPRVVGQLFQNLDEDTAGSVQTNLQNGKVQWNQVALEVKVDGMVLSSQTRLPGMLTWVQQGRLCGSIEATARSEALWSGISTLSLQHVH